MGLFVSRLYQRLFAYKEFKICLVGLDNAGKTTILFQLHMGELVDTQPTIGSNVEEVVHKNIHFQVWDLGGQESIRKGWSSYFLNTHAIIMVVDSTDHKRIPTVRDELFKLLECEELSGAVILVFANKSDSRGSLSGADLASELNLQSIKKHSWHIQSCCALTGQGLYEGIDWITQKVTTKS